MQAWDCDFLACSAYKFFGPHVGILWGKRPLLEALPAYKVRPAPDTLPDRWMTGTQNHEGIAGALAAVEYLADLGGRSHPALTDRRPPSWPLTTPSSRYERELCRLSAARPGGAAGVTGLRHHRPGAAGGARADGVVSRTRKPPPRAVAEHLDRHGIFVWHGNYYALALTEALGLEPEGMVRVGLLHYNTEEEVNRLLAALQELD